MTTTAPAFRRLGLLRLSWPLIVVTVLTLIGALGNVVILTFASEELNAAIATANQILGLLYDISVLFSIGALVVISQLLGAGEGARAQRAVVVALRSSTWLGLGIAVFVAALGPVIVRLINTPAELVDDANAYLWIVAGGMLCNAMIVAASAVLRAYGRTALLLIIAVVVNICDVLLLGLFVLVLDLGVVGAALPTLLIRGIGVLLLLWLVRRATGVGLLTPLRALPAPTRRSGAGWMARLSIPSVLENGAYNAVILIAVAFVNLLGTDAINGRSWALTLTALVTGVILAVAQGNETIVGWDVGERSLGATRRRTLQAAAWTALSAAVLAALLWLGGSAILSFVLQSPAAIDLALEALGLSILLLPLSAAATVLYGALRSAGDVIVPMVCSIIASVGVLLPLSWLLIQQFQLGLAGAFWALIAAEAVKAALLLWRWLGGRWARIPAVAADSDGESRRQAETAD